MRSETTTRVVTGVIGGLALLALIVWGGWAGIFILTIVLSLAMIWEYGAMTFTLPDQAEKRYAMILTAWFSSLVLTFAIDASFEVLIFCFLSTFVYYLFTAARHTGPAFKTHLLECMGSVFGLIYLLFIPFFLPRIHGSSNGVQWTILFLTIVFANDTGAYFAGRKWGKTKLYPAVSPKKTLEGSLGGLAGGYLLTLFAKLTYLKAMSWGAVIFIPPLVGSIAQIGDFCESYIKRAFDKKDSGSILPGHGGIMDRFDGVLFGLPVMYACIRFFTA